MKTIIILGITAAALISIFFVLQAFSSKSTQSTETRQYSVVEVIDEVEIRSYGPANYSSVTMPAASYKEVSSQGFRVLAGYIFGGNEQGASIAMTTPVAMEMADSITMKFMVPSNWEVENLPNPNDPSIHFSTEGKVTMAVLQFDGWANDERIESYSQQLLSTLEAHQIPHHKQVSFFGYNPPYEVINRRNEVAVELME